MKTKLILINNNICYDSDYGGPFKSVADNVRHDYQALFISAPEMLEALEGLLAQLKGYSASTFTDATQANMIKAAQAIAKARGES